MGFIHGRCSEIDIIGSDDWQARMMGKRQQSRLKPCFLIPAMAVEFYGQTIRKSFLQLRQQFFGRGLLTIKQEARKRAKRAAREQEKPFRMVSKLFQRNGRLA